MSTRYVRLETTISMVANTVISGVFAWLLFRNVDSVPLLGAEGIIVDLIPTVFMITFMTVNIETLLTRSRIRSGTALSEGYSVGWLPDFWLLRALTLSLLITLTVVPLTGAVLLLADVSTLPYTTFFIFKLVFGAALALLITPPILRLAIGDSERQGFSGLR